MDELKACPFCGGTADLMETADGGEWYVACIKCLCGTAPTDEPEDVIVAAWNRRAPNPGAKVEWKKYGDGTREYVCVGGFSAVVGLDYETGLAEANIATDTDEFNTLWRGCFDTADLARAECVRRLSLLLAATANGEG